MWYMFNLSRNIFVVKIFALIKITTKGKDTCMTNITNGLESVMPRDGAHCKQYIYNIELFFTL